MVKASHVARTGAQWARTTGGRQHREVWLTIRGEHGPRTGLAAVVLCWCRADTGILEVPKGLPVPTACGALRASCSFATACSCAVEVFSEGQGRPGWGQGPCASSSSSPECQEVAAFMGVQSEFFWGPCHVPGLALAVGVGRNTTDYGVAQGTSGRAWSKKGCHPPHFTTQCRLPPLDSPPPPISCILCPGPTHPCASGSCPAAPSTPSTPSMFLLRLPGGSRPAMSAPSHLLSLDCCTLRTKCSVAPPDPNFVTTDPALFPELPPHTPSQSLHSHSSPDGSPTGLSVTFHRVKS